MFLYFQTLTYCEKLMKAHCNWITNDGKYWPVVWLLLFLLILTKKGSPKHETKPKRSVNLAYLAKKFI